MIFKPRPISKLIIVGLGSSCYDWILDTYEFNDPDTEVWTINAGSRIFRHDVVWDMHTPEWLKAKDCDRALRRREWFKSHDKPIVMPKHYPDLPMSKAYPLRDVIEFTGSCYFSTGIAYPLAFAMMCDLKHLKVFGFEFDYGSGKENGANCAEYWIGRLVQSGTKVQISPNSALCDVKKRQTGTIYGYHEPVEFEFPEKGGKGKLLRPDYAH